MAIPPCRAARLRPGGRRRAAGTLVAALLALPIAAWPHGYAGKRIFPTTFEVDDPFVMDEFSLLATYRRQAGAGPVPGFSATTLSADYTARITGHWGITAAGEFRRIEPEGGGAMNGFDNLVVGTKYQFYTSDVHEAILSVGLDASVGTTGDRRVGADPHSVIAPIFFFGKGFGDLPEWARYGRPLAVTGTLGAAFPTAGRSAAWNPPGAANAGSSRNPASLVWGFTVQYSLEYLQAHVADLGLTRPFDRMIGVVEFAMESCLNAGCVGQTTGSVNPGLIWFGEYLQLGLAAQIPVDRRSGSHVGVMGLFHLFVDDLLEDHEHD